MKYTLVIPCAGLGLRTKQFSKHINKALITVGQKPVICHIIDNMRPLIDKVVIALGYKGQIVREILSEYYKNQKDDLFEFVYVDKYQGVGSGLGYTLFCCQQHLQKPFIFSSNDTITSILQFIPSLNERNIMFYSDKKYNIEDYRTITVLQNQVLAINPKLSKYELSKKVQKQIMYPYIGTSIVWDYKNFWQNMHKNQQLSIKTGQVSGFGFQTKIHAIKVREWFDLGNSQHILETQQILQSNDKTILPKQTEGIWFTDDNRVIKFNTDAKFIEDRCQRLRLLDNVKQYFPQIIGQTPHTYTYMSLPGTIMSKIYDRQVFLNILQTTYNNFWMVQPCKVWADLSGQQKNAINQFYYNKTVDRINSFLNVYEILNQQQQNINNIATPSIAKLIEIVDFNELSESGLYTKYFHGDYHMQNILHNSKTNQIYFLDWRQNFGSGNFNSGDIYYDLAKFKQSLIVSHENIKNQLYSVRTQSNNIYYDIMIPKKNIDMIKIFNNFCVSHGFDINRVNIITALVFLNIAVLHQPDEYAMFLFYLGKDLLNKALNNQEILI